MNIEVTVACEHSRELTLVAVVENVYRNVKPFSIGKLIAHSQRSTCALSYHHVALTQPGGVLLVDAGIFVASLFLKAQFATTHMLSEHRMTLCFHVVNHATIKGGVNSAAPNRSRKINFHI